MSSKWCGKVCTLMLNYCRNAKETGFADAKMKNSIDSFPPSPAYIDT